MAPRATAIKEQGLSEAVAARIEAPQKGSTRSVYDAKWTIFTKWCVTNQVDLRAPPVKSVADFLMYLFQDRKLQPITIDGYRSAIADKLGNSPFNISKDENLTRLLDSFHRDRPKGRKGIPSWNLSLVLHQLTKAPFEPIRQAIQTRPDHPNRVVSSSRGFPSNMQQVAPASNRPVCHKVQQQVASVSPVPDPLATAVDALSLPWEDLDAYAFPPAAILGKVVEKLQDSPCKRIILIAPGWPNMPWFWDLVTMSSQIPLSLPFLPNLLTQPFNQIPHRNLTNLNLHAWLLEPQQSRSRACLRQWQQELRLLKKDQPDQSMMQSGPFLQSGASLIRWTSGHPL